MNIKTKPKIPDLTITLPATKLDVLTDNHGEYTSGKCIACDNSGFVNMKL